MTAQGRRRSAEELTMEAVRLVEESTHSVARWVYDLGKGFSPQCPPISDPEDVG
jgi:hypothetical protein